MVPPIPAETEHTARPLPRRTWSTLDFLLKCRPDQYCDVPPPGQAMSNRTFMRRQAERIVRSPKLSRQQRASIERVWLTSQSATVPL